jgi:nucleoside 2-deoxyribosyltransferase
MIDYAIKMKSKGHKVILPALDDRKFKSALEIILTNKKRMESADEVHMFYDGRSQGTLVDFGMAFMAGKPLKIIYLNDKNIVDAMKEYAWLFEGESGHFESEDMNNKSWVTRRYYHDFKDLDKNLKKS